MRKNWSSKFLVLALLGGLRVFYFYEDENNVHILEVSAFVAVLIF